MASASLSAEQSRLAILTGPPLEQEPGLGALTLPGYFREITERFRDRELLVMHGPTGVVRWSYGELWDRATEVAKALIACGVGKESRVAIMMANRPEWLAAAFGTWLAGGMVVTISTFSAPPELEYQLQLSGASVLLFDGQVLKKDFVADLAGLDPAIAHASPGHLESRTFPFLRHLVVTEGANAGGAIEGWASFLARGKDGSVELLDAIADSIQPTDAATLLFSSGSTGRPKGIVSSHRAVCISLWRAPRLMGIEEDIRCWTPNGFFWSATIVMTLGGTLSRGGSVVIQPTFDAAEAVRLIEVERVTYPIAMPHHWARMQATPGWPAADLSSLRYVHPASIPGCHPSVSADYTVQLGSYGGTETFTYHSGSFADAAPPEKAGKSNGRPLPGNRVKIVDPETGALLARGERGEIATKGPTLMIGYAGVPSERYLDAEGFFRSGDGGYIDEEGWLHFEGRLSEIIKTGGAKVALNEVDMVLALYPGIRAAKTVGVPHETLGEVLIACVVPADGTRLEEEAITAFLKERLASYKVPRRVLFLEDGGIPMTGTGKIQLAELRKVARERLSITERSG